MCFCVMTKVPSRDGGGAPGRLTSRGKDYSNRWGIWSRLNLSLIRGLGDSEENPGITAEMVCALSNVLVCTKSGRLCHQDCDNIFHRVLFFHMERCLLTKLNASGTKAGSVRVCAWLSQKQGQMHSRSALR